MDENFDIVEGEVLAHSKDKNEIYQKLLQIRPKEFSIEYTGVIPEDIAVVMVLLDNFTILAHTLPIGSYVDGLLVN